MAQNVGRFESLFSAPAEPAAELPGHGREAPPDKPGMGPPPEEEKPTYQDLERKYRHRTYQAQELMVEKLLRGHFVDEKALERKLHMFDLDFSAPRYLVVLVCPAGNDTMFSGYDSDLRDGGQVGLIVSSIFSELLGERFSCYPANLEDRYAFLLNFDRTDDAELSRQVAEISRDESMKPISKIREMRILANAYNALLKRRDRLEAILRSAAETDALTGLPNRYSMEHCALELETEEEGGSIAVLVFDVNYLKQINDTEGHFAGDKLIRTAADCIRECFSSDSGDNCFRIGGDEFCAILRRCRPVDVKERLDRFEQALKRENISVSVGSAWSEKLDEGSFKRLLGEADEHMYEKKKKIHESKG